MKYLSILFSVLFWFGVFLSAVSIIAVAVLLIHPDTFSNVGSVYNTAAGVFHFRYPQVTVYPPDLLTSPIFFILYTLLFWFFRRLFKNLLKGNLFVNSNAKAIIGIGILLLVNSLVGSLPSFLIARQMIPLVNTENVQITATYTVQTSLLLASLLIIMLGVFFNKAVKIANENELTI